MMKNKDFAIFIMVYGRPEKAWTYKTLRKCGYTGEIYFVGDNTDEKIQGYIDKYGDKVLVFDKEEVAKHMDSGDNTGDLRSTLFSANTIFDFAEELGKKYFMIMCDDYTEMSFTFDKERRYKSKKVEDLDSVIDRFIEFYKNTPTTTIAFAQGGDFIGGAESGNAIITLKRKAMNSFLCSTERRFQFVGRMNEDVTTYVRLGSIGKLFFTNTMMRLEQKPSQKEKGGLTELYTDYGTYVKSFFSVMYNPSCVKVIEMGTKNKRVHHEVSWGSAVPKILRSST